MRKEVAFLFRILSHGWNLYSKKRHQENLQREVKQRSCEALVFLFVFLRGCRGAHWNDGGRKHTHTRNKTTIMFRALPKSKITKSGGPFLHHFLLLERISSERLLLRCATLGKKHKRAKNKTKKRRKNPVLNPLFFSVLFYFFTISFFPHPLLIAFSLALCCFPVFL